jgi:hypothetical protein
MARWCGWKRWGWLIAGIVVLVLSVWLLRGPKDTTGGGPLRGADGATEADAFRRYRQNPIEFHLIPRVRILNSPRGSP